MSYFNSREIAAIALFSALWGVTNGIFAPIVFRATGLPILCDMVGFTILILTVWWIRKLGAVTMVGLTATIVNLVLNPAGLQFLGFTVASFVFDTATRLIGYNRVLNNLALFRISMLSISALSASVAGLIIGTFFLASSALVRWGGVIGWVGLHAAGGLMGAVIGVFLVRALVARHVKSI